MDIKKVNQEGVVTYYIKGRLDVQTSPKLQSMLEESFGESETNLVLDFKDVEYMSSAALRVILYAQKKVNTIDGASLTITHVQPDVMEVFELTGFTDFLKINS